MNNLFLLIFIISIVAIAILLIVTIIQFTKKNSLKGKKFLKFTSIAIATAVISFIGFGVTLDEVDREKAAEINAAKKAEKAVAESIAKEEAEAKAKAKAEEKANKEAIKAAEEKAKAEDEAAAIAEKKANAQPIPYPQLKKNPDRHKGEYVKYVGKILQIMESDDITHIRLSVTETDYGYDYDDVIFVEYLGLTDFVDEDIVTVYGEIYGSYSYESQAGFKITLPGLLADTVE
ncbi:hypothetical protein A0U40_17585 [[Bacillus] sp. KCTC 13219]|nr:hypothetical protein A0U40_17585 [[Bacillus] sp. KCTC 13219]